jgi:hypothetical protein
MTPRLKLPRCRTLAAPGDSEGWGEVADSRALDAMVTETYLTLPRPRAHWRRGPLPLPLKGG